MFKSVMFKSLIMAGCALTVGGIAQASEVCRLEGSSADDLAINKIRAANLNKATDAKKIQFFEQLAAKPDAHCVTRLTAKFFKAGLLIQSGAGSLESMSDLMSDPDFLVPDFSKLRDESLALAISHVQTEQEMTALANYIATHAQTLSDAAPEHAALFAYALNLGPDRTQVSTFANRLLNHADAARYFTDMVKSPGPSDIQTSSGNIAVNALTAAEAWDDIDAFAAAQLDDGSPVESKTSTVAWSVLLAYAARAQAAPTVPSNAVRASIAFYEARDDAGSVNPESAQFLQAVRHELALAEGRSSDAEKILAKAAKRFGSDFSTASAIKTGLEESTTISFVKIVEPIVKKYVSPSWPASAQTEQAECMVYYNLDDRARPQNVRATCNNDAFEASAEDAVRRFKYTPRTEDGVPVARYNIVQQIDFKF